MGKFTLKCKDVDVAGFSYDERQLFEHLTDDFLLQLVQDVYSQNHRINETRIEKMGNMLTGARNKLAYLQKKNSRRAGNGR